MSSESNLPRHFTGGCHCGAIRFRVRVERFEALDCNCSICQKKGFLHLIVPPDQFELLQGTEALQTYTFNTGVAQHHFCRICGIAPFYRPRSHPDQFDVNLRCLDEPLDTLLTLFHLQPFDGRRWEQNIDQILRPVE
ncbi:MAG: GFA family protein [Thermosynechococcaceae cyanobacterium]